MFRFKKSSLPYVAIGFIIPAAAARLARTMAGSGYSLVTHNDPPRNPAHPDVEWREAVTWTICSAVIGGLAQLAMRRWLATTVLPVQGLDYDSDVEDD